MSWLYRFLAILIITRSDFQMRNLLGRLDFRQLRRIRKRIMQAEGYGSSEITIGDEVSALLDGIDLKGLPPVVIDGGANVGDYTAEILAKSPSATVYSFEPSPESFQILTLRFEGDHRVIVQGKALGKKSSVEKLFFDREGSSLSSLVKRDLRHFGIEGRESVEVDVVRLSDWCATNGVQPVALKLDIEGAELPVIEDAVKNIESLSIIAFEFGGANLDSRTIFRDFYNFFSEKNWTVSRLTISGLVDIPAYSEFDEIYVKCDYVARRKVKDVP